MSKTIYISRKCEYCHELLILLHKNKNILDFPVIDVHTKPYPKIVTSVPCMVVDGKLLPGEELFKFVNYLIEQNSKKGDSPENDLQQPMTNNMNGHKNMGPMNNNNPINLNMPTGHKNLNIPGNVDNNSRDNTKDNFKPDNMLPQQEQNNDEDDLLPGFCIGGVCELGFSSIENDKDISMDNSFEMLDSNGDITPQMDMGHTKNEKAKQMDDDYSRMMQDRGNDLGMKSN
jgi:hypothetical protein